MATKPLLIFSTVDITRLSTLSYDARMNLDMPPPVQLAGLRHPTRD